MIWPFLWAAAFIAFALAVASKRMAYIYAAGSVLAAYFATRIFDDMIRGDLHLVGFAAAWIAFAGYALRKSGIATVSLLMVASGLCYLWARVVDAPNVIGSVPFVLSDLFSLAATAIIGGMAGNVVYRNGLLDRNSDRRGIYSGNRAGMDAPETCQTASEVMQ